MSQKEKETCRSIQNFLSQVKDIKEPTEKIHVVTELFRFLLARKDFVFSHRTFYDTMIDKLVELSYEVQYPQFVHDCKEWTKEFTDLTTVPTGWLSASSSAERNRIVEENWNFASQSTLQ